jgi:hypothetical protein
LVWIELYNLHPASLPLPGPPEFLSPVQDVFGPRDNSERTRNQPFEMPFVECDYVIQQVSSTIVNPTFGDSVLPWTAEAGSFRCDAEAFYDADDLVVEVCSAIKDQIVRG